MATFRQRHRSDGSSSWHVQIRKEGHPPVTATFQRKTDAREWAQNTEVAIRDGNYFKIVVAKRPTVARAIDRFIEEVVPQRAKQRRDFMSHLEWWRSEVGRYYLAALTPSVLATARDKLLNGVTVRGTQRAPATVLRMMASLSAVFKVAERDWNWIERSPMARISRFAWPIL